MSSHHLFHSYLGLLVEDTCSPDICGVFFMGFAFQFEVYSIQLYVIKFVKDLRQVGRFLRVLWFPPIKLTATI
jgi:hypothetical protein